MGLKDWAKHRGMKQPVPGVFVVQDSYNSGASVMLTGVLSGQGVAPFASEVKIGLHDRWLHAASSDLPAVIDAAQPRNFRILWDDVVQVTAQQRARMLAQQAAAAAGGQPMPSVQMPAGEVPADGFEAGQPMAGISDVGGPMMVTFNKLLGGNLGQQLPHGRSISHVSTSMTVNGVPVDPSSQAAVSSLLANLGGLIGGAGQANAGTMSDALLREGAGVAAEALVLAAHDLPEAQWPAGPRPPAGYVGFAFDVTGPDGTTWSATALQGFLTPERRAAASVVGSRLPVRFDPAAPARVAIDLQRLAPGTA